MIGQTLNHYQVLREIGRGAMGQVFLARDLRLDRPVALKLLPPALVTDEKRRKRFDRESKALAALNHPNIVTIHSIEESEGQPFLVMEHIQGKSLEELIPLQGLPLDRYFELALPMVEAVDCAHQAGIVHRDLKPANIMVRDDGVLKVVDFGISKIEQETVLDADLLGSMERLTGEGLVLGTVPYMSPEQLEGRAVDARSDIFALGVILYEMAVGVRPFQGERASLVSAIMRDDPPRLSEKRESLPAALETIVERCLAKRPQDRFQTAAALRNELQALRREMELGTALPSSSTPAFSLPSDLPTLPTLPALPVPAAAPTRQGLADSGKTAWLRHPLLAAALVAAVTAGTIVGSRLWRDRTDAPTAAQPRPVAGTILPAVARPAAGSIAVLPLRNMSGDAAQEFFSDGTTEAMIANLAKIGGLRVSSRDAVMRYKSGQAGLRQIARELAVDHVLEGSVLRSGDQLMIIVQLVDPKTNGTVWGDTYRGSMRDIFAFQQQVAEAVARQTKGEISTSDRSRLAAVQQVAPDVYETYLRARYLLNQRNPEAVRQALGLLDQALARDPRYALGWAARAEAWLILIADSNNGTLPAREGLPKAREAARQALELDPNLSEAHAALALAHLQSWEWDKVESGFRRALELNPSNAEAYLRYSVFLTSQGRHDEAIKAIEMARQLDPGSLVIRIASNYAHILAKRYDRAAEIARATISLRPEVWIPHLQLGVVLSLQGRYAEADTELREAVRLGGSNPLALSTLARNEALAGRPEPARRIVAELETASRSAWVPPTALAHPLFALGEADRGFAWLQKAVDEKDQTLLIFNVSPYYAPYRADPRYQHILRQLGLDRG
jgi:TolB-like protein/Tfp pilus assembly protein PilF